MDRDDSTAVKLTLTAGLLFLMSAYFSFTELRYLISGATAEAQVTDVRDERGGRRSGPYRIVEYRFAEADGTTRSEKDDVPLETPVESGATIVVHYLPGIEDSSRLTGTAKRTWVVIFFASLAWLGWSVFGLIREARQPVGRTARRRA